jgi:UDP-N-acetylglucosamine--N-acetylmuramyl-(pentapeptide) pyrophosphoryl-undecaprenol N-acetylglucosamine transferase
VVRAAHKKGSGHYIHEQKRFPGVTIRLLEKYVNKVFISFPESKEYFKDQSKLVVTGNPIRKSFLLGGSGRSREKIISGPKICDSVLRRSLGRRQDSTHHDPYHRSVNGMTDVRLYFITGNIITGRC